MTALPSRLTGGLVLVLVITSLLSPAVAAAQHAAIHDTVTDTHNYADTYAPANRNYDYYGRLHVETAYQINPTDLAHGVGGGRVFQQTFNMMQGASTCAVGPNQYGSCKSAAEGITHSGGRVIDKSTNIVTYYIPGKYCGGSPIEKRTHEALETTALNIAKLMAEWVVTSHPLGEVAGKIRALVGTLAPLFSTSNAKIWEIDFDHTHDWGQPVAVSTHFITFDVRSDALNPNTEYPGAETAQFTYESTVALKQHCQNSVGGVECPLSVFDKHIAQTMVFVRDDVPVGVDPGSNEKYSFHLDRTTFNPYSPTRATTDGDSTQHPEPQGQPRMSDVFERVLDAW